MIEASFMTDDGEILQKRMVDEDRLFESYCTTMNTESLLVTV